jgi:small subunit ribosomal protein S6e
LASGTSCYRAKREGTAKRKSVRGCIIGPEIAAVNLVIIKKGNKEIKDLTDKRVDRRLGPKRANKIRKLFNLPRHIDNKKEKSKTKI